MPKQIPDPLSADRDREISNVVLPVIIFAFSVWLGLQYLGWV